ncbi:putative kinesin-related motor protein [Erysiphe neolycopersici]|uniref:Putative kinesin-related motor protein n=1 Tax=Erysiphe neolycopersici TaxID=212602 RepID=A0A420HX75_9PEZI|nr:putative kinesin-related motor protein [Erysiphe neolycopersici]
MPSAANGGNIKVVVRVRPFNEIDRGAKCIIQMKDAQTILTPPPGYEDRTKSKSSSRDISQKVFAFDKSYWSFNRLDDHYAGQSDLHNDLGKPLLDNAFKGYNNCIFAYGQTGSGKSYSMMGYGKEAGVIPQICQDMFIRIENMQKDPNLRFTVEVSYLEIYNERVRDLLNPSTKGNLKVREHPSTGPYVEDLAKLVVGSFNEIEHLMDEGNKARTVAATNMNETSSRSHAVFTLTVTQKRRDKETNMTMEKVAKISLVDLAGSERATSTGATGARLKEGAEINRSLSTLGRVIAALADLSDGKKKKVGKGVGQVPYRDSVLTWLLKDSLGGNSMTAMIAAISPADINFDETLSTLRYADSAKRIKNHAVVNEDANARMIRELKEELEALRGKLSGGAGELAEEMYPDNVPFDKQLVSITQSDGTIKKVSKAEIAEQLSQSEKLYHDLNQTWEEKLAKTEEIHKEREAVLEELGISIEKGFVGLHTPKKMPHLVNLSDDPLLAECLVYNLKPGITTVGNVENNTGQSLEIRLNGSRILNEHCTFENVDNVVTLVPKQSAAIMVNGNRIVEPKRLRSGYRVILGDFHIFRFNHPMEARAERVDKSSLRHSIVAQQIGDADGFSPSPTSRLSHERKVSKAFSEAEWDGSRPDSPLTYRTRDSDWSLARREAAGAILGSDKQISGLTDEELNILFEDVQKARAERAFQSIDDDTDSVISYSFREKYLSNGTLDNYSFDTALTTPSSPKQGETEDIARDMRTTQAQSEENKEEHQENSTSENTKNLDVEEIRKEKACIEEDLRDIKVEMLRKLDEQRKEFQERIQELNPSKTGSSEIFPALSKEEQSIVKRISGYWRSRNYIKMTESILQAAANLKEAQVLSLEMDQGVFFQFTIIQTGHELWSSYDMVLSNTSDRDDPFLEEAVKPCIGVRVIDYHNSVIHLWSLDKLQRRIHLMRQMHQLMDKPEYIRQYKLQNPFTGSSVPQFTHIGDVNVPLSAVFESRVQDFTIDVVSPYTSHTIGILKLSLEPSLARAPSTTLNFNVVVHDLIGFAEREGTDVHVQIFLPEILGDASVSTSQMIRNFDEGPVRFESVHNQSIPVIGSTESCLRIAIFARVTSMHFEKLLSWDDMQENGMEEKRKRKYARVSESYFLNEERYEIFAKIKILELAENGEYLPVRVIHKNNNDRGLFQLHQGLQRRIMINLIHSSDDVLPWQDVSCLRASDLHLEDENGNILKKRYQDPVIPLKLISKPIIKQNSNGTSSVTLIGQWESSVCSPLILDRITANKLNVKTTFSWDVTSPKLSTPLTFSMETFSVILPRSYFTYSSILGSVLQNFKKSFSVSGIFSVSIRPSPVKRARDLWRISTLDNYVKGEEILAQWRPRGVSLVWDYIATKKRSQRIAEIEAAQPILDKFSHQKLRNSPFTPDTSSNINHSSNETNLELSDRSKELLKKYTRIWKLCRDPISTLITPSNTEPPIHGISSPPPQSSSSYLLTSIILAPKNPIVLKSGYLLTPSRNPLKWVQRFVELRRPYLHIYTAVDGEEVFIISLRNSQVDYCPPIAKILRRDGGMKGRHFREENFFAIYGTDNTWLFMASDTREKIEWTGKIDMRNFS